MLKSMQILPVAENSKIALLENNIVDTASKGKRKACSNTIADESRRASEQKSHEKEGIDVQRRNRYGD
jgi:hypothetical protein